MNCKILFDLRQQILKALDKPISMIVEDSCRNPGIVLMSAKSVGFDHVPANKF
jgi:hypothetical protein